MAARIPQLEEPEKQKKYRQEYLDEVCAKPEPEPLTYLADSLHYEALDKIGDRSNPSEARKELAAFYRRHAVSLQHKKYRMLGRWADLAMSSETVDLTAEHFDRIIGKLQKEMDSALSRTERLELDDNHGLAIDPEAARP